MSPVYWTSRPETLRDMPQEALRRGRQRFYDPAFRDRSATALIDQVVQLCFQRL